MDGGEGGYLPWRGYLSWSGNTYPDRGTYLARGTYPSWGVHTLARENLSWMGVPTLTRSAYPGWGIPTLDEGYLSWLGRVPTLDRLCRGLYASCGFPLEDFLFIYRSTSNSMEDTEFFRQDRSSPVQEEANFLKIA